MRSSPLCLDLDLDEIPQSLRRSLRGQAHFQQVDYHPGTWIRRKHHPLPRREVRRCSTHSGRCSHNGIAFYGSASVKIERYRYRDSKIPIPCAVTNHDGVINGQDTQRGVQGG